MNRCSNLTRVNQLFVVHVLSKTLADILKESDSFQRNITQNNFQNINDQTYRVGMEHHTTSQNILVCNLQKSTDILINVSLALYGI